MKKYLFFAVALLGMASCAKEDVDNGNKPIHSGEIEESYIAINLSASDITRAEDGGFNDGTDAERAVNHADFFFFDEYGNPFPVQVNGDTTSQGGEINHLSATSVTFTKDSESTDNDDISDTSNPVLLLKTYKGQYPSQIVAVLNWSPESKAYSLADLYAAVNITTRVDGKDYFVMSNSAYAQGTTEVCATPLTNENIKTTEADALSAPVNIYVERVAAKVQVNAANGNKYTVKEDSNGNVYAKILSWDLYRDNTQSKLLKDIDASWTNASLGFTWNDDPWYRSYWATSLSAPTNDQIFGTSPLAAGAFTYIGENTTGKATCTKVVIKAQLVNNAGVAQEIAIWNNVEYVSAPNSGGLSLRTAVANTLKYKYFAKTGEGETAEYTGLKPEDLQCVKGGAEGAPAAANEVYFQLSTDGAAKNWYKLVNGEYLPVANDTANDPKSINATNEALKSVPAALLYENGETFYYVDIEHLGNGQGKPGDYGIVRNHVYNITINSITGYGSPVYTGVSFLGYPDINEQGTYVSAKINILSWKLVNQGVNITPGN